MVEHRPLTDGPSLGRGPTVQNHLKYILNGRKKTAVAQNSMFLFLIYLFLTNSNPRAFIYYLLRAHVV